MGLCQLHPIMLQYPSTLCTKGRMVNTITCGSVATSLLTQGKTLQSPEMPTIDVHVYIPAQYRRLITQKMLPKSRTIAKEMIQNRSMPQQPTTTVVFAQHTTLYESKTFIKQIDSHNEQFQLNWPFYLFMNVKMTFMTVVT